MNVLDSRPEPRHVFDDIARSGADRRVLHPAHRAVDMCRIILHAALQTGRREVIETVRREIVHYFDECRESALRELCSPEADSVAEVMIEFHKESAEAMNAVMEAGTLRTESAIETAVREVRELSTEGERLGDVLQASLSMRRGTLAMRAAR